jgi:hypothetical protein
VNTLRVAVAAALYAATLTSWLVAVWSPYHWQWAITGFVFGVMGVVVAPDPKPPTTPLIGTDDKEVSP